jgi:hypothetical protein
LLILDMEKGQPLNGCPFRRKVYEPRAAEKHAGWTGYRNV